MTNHSCYCVSCGKEMPEHYIYCPACGANQRQSAQTQQLRPIEPQYIGLQQSHVAIDIASGFNWGAFWGGWIWGLGNKVRITLIQLVLLFTQIIIILTTRSYMATAVPGMINFALMIYFGANGNAWAWSSRHYVSVEQFRAVQHRWAFWMIVTYICVQVTTTLVWSRFHYIG